MNFEIYITAAWLIFVIVWAVGSLLTKPTARKQSPGSALLHRSIFMAAVLLLFAHIRLPGSLDLRLIPKGTAVSWAALASTVTGIGFAIWARFYLGGNWSSSVTIKHDHNLVRSGPYAFVRHAIYSGILLALVGTTLVSGKVRGLMGLVVAVVGFRMKSYVEENFMIRQFGAQYGEYKREVKALVPFIW